VAWTAATAAGPAAHHRSSTPARVQRVGRPHPPPPEPPLFARRIDGGQKRNAWGLLRLRSRACGGGGPWWRCG